jgi:pimeloyl-ACP methyl ester carboxylesterase
VTGEAVSLGPLAGGAVDGMTVPFQLRVVSLHPTSTREPASDARLEPTMTSAQPTIVLVHGAGAESAGWNGVIRILQERGFTTIAAANPLRSLSSDAAYVASLLATLEGPLVLVGHSYGGSVISNAARGNDAVKTLVFVAAFAPDEGESVLDLAKRFPGSAIGDSLHAVPLPDGTTDLYIRADKYQQTFAADAAPARAALDAATQRPFRDVALTEGSGPDPAWKTVPSWFVNPELDSVVPVAAHRFMAERANARETVDVPGASHAVAASRPEVVANTIFTAATHMEVVS